jgi:hypothetical protein
MSSRAIKLLSVIAVVASLTLFAVAKSPPEAVVRGDAYFSHHSTPHREEFHSLQTKNDVYDYYTTTLWAGTYLGSNQTVDGTRTGTASQRPTGCAPDARRAVFHF